MLFVVGPTATGKTNLAFQLSKLLPSIIISADSRQVYKEMDIVTGKDHPLDMNLLGINLVFPNEPCSVGVWYDAVQPLVIRAWEKGLLPIVVGGTGLYIKALSHGIETIHIPPDMSLRARLNDLSLTKLQEEVKLFAPNRFANMNNSDQNNPRRLIRAIEIAESHTIPKVSPKPDESLFLGLTNLATDQYRGLITSRVQSRLRQGAIPETKNICQKYGKNISSLSALGYVDIISFIEGKISESELVSNWTDAEISYSKRQLTWFKKNENIQWFDPTMLDLLPKLENLVREWYYKVT